MAAFNGISKHAARIEPMLQQLKPNDWVAKGAPDTYVTQWNSAIEQLHAIQTDMSALAQHPDQMTECMKALFRVQASHGRWLRSWTACAAIRIRRSPNSSNPLRPKTRRTSTIWSNICWNWRTKRISNMPSWIAKPNAAEPLYRGSLPTRTENAITRTLMTTTMPFVCSICEEQSTRICVKCTKDTCANHLCEKCAACSDCCDCEVRLMEESLAGPHEPEPHPHPMPDPDDDPEPEPEPIPGLPA